MWRQRLVYWFLLGHDQFAQACQKTSFISQNRSVVVIWVPPFPVRKNQYLWPLLANHACDSQAVLPGVFYASIRDVECSAPGNPQDAGCLGRFACPIFGGAARPHLGLSEIEDSRGSARLRHPQSCFPEG